MLTIRDPPFRIPPKPPFPWGASPFRARGILYRDQIAHVDRALAPLGTSVDELVRRTGDRALEVFLSQPFDSMSWYDLQPGVWAIEIVASHRGITPAHQIRESVVALVDGSLRGFSGVLLKVLSNEAVASWLPRISTWFHDFGALETHVVDRGHVRGVRHGVPSFFVQLWAESATCFIERVLERVGAKEPRAYTLNVEPDGVNGPVTLYRIPFEVRWTP